MILSTKKAQADGKEMKMSHYYYILFLSAEPPDEPRNLKILEASSTSARLSWDTTRPPPIEAAMEDHLPILSFTLEWTLLQG